MRRPIMYITLGAALMLLVWALVYGGRAAWNRYERYQAKKLAAVEYHARHYCITAFCDNCKNLTRYGIKREQKAVGQPESCGWCELPGVIRSSDSSKIKIDQWFWLQTDH